MTPLAIGEFAYGMSIVQEYQRLNTPEYKLQAHADKLKERLLAAVAKNLPSKAYGRTGRDLLMFEDNQTQAFLSANRLTDTRSVFDTLVNQ